MTSNRLKHVLHVALLIAVTACLTGLTWINGKITWQFLLPWNSTNYDSAGIPKPSTGYIFKNTTSHQQRFLNFVTTALPGRDEEDHQELFHDSNARNIYVSEAIIKNNPTKSVYVSFIYECSNYRNSLGYFLFDADNPPTSKTDNARILTEKVIFPNASFFNSGGSTLGLKSGDSVYLDLTPAIGKTSNGVIGIGFFLVADGFSATEGVRSTALADWIFHTSGKELNSETGTSPVYSISYKEHTVLIKEQGEDTIALAIEETNRDSGSDHYFNDVIYSITVTPPTAIVSHFNPKTNATEDIYTPTPSPAVVDSDGDGIADSLDEYPKDANRASSSWHPSKTGMNSLAFEDNWPYLGDYDMNDLVVNYRYRQILNPQGLVKEIEIIYQLMASGARYHNGFAVEFTGIPAGVTLDYPSTSQAIKGATLSVNGGSAQSISPITPNNYLVYQIFSDALVEFGKSEYVNTIKGSTNLSGKTYKLNIAFATPLQKSAFINGPLYNPFLFRSGGLEIHLPGRPPTSAANMSLIGTQDDNTSKNINGNGPFYVSNSKTFGKTGYPWALDIPQGWKWPTEYASIVVAYPQFKAWVESSGTSQTSWYLSPSSSSNIYP